MLRKEKRGTQNGPRFSFLCLVELRLKTKIQMYYKKRKKVSYLAFVPPPPHTHQAKHRSRCQNLWALGSGANCLLIAVEPILQMRKLRDRKVK